ncbi:MAG: hypothetical protein GIW99_10860 [Candidatus Eremiobacteraeota bacterium]|nr:hypothetical protein [Candidatus Eremiobacteraeota bacterium]MBC5828162.1 hypothetical protein [Candidatus Eremiobacteraeota bacterium]
MVRGAAIIAWVAMASAPLLAHASGIDTVGAYAGTWETHIAHFKTTYSKPRSESATLRNVCWRSAGYFACDQFVDGLSKTLIVFTYDKQRNTYHTYAVPTDGSAATSGTLLISGNTWIYPWQDKDGKKTVYLRVVNTFIKADIIRFRQEFSFDKRHWTIASAGTERRLR